MSGLTNNRPSPILSDTDGEFGISLISDCHIGASITDYDLLEWDLATAYKSRDRILIGGDVFDTILPSDARRYEPGALDKDIAGSTDVVNASVKKAYDILLPYVNLIDGIGYGNHETVVLRKHSVDMIQMLLDKLNPKRDRGVIDNLGYTGFISYDLKCTTRAKVKDTYVIWYNHGTGRVASEGAGLTRLMRNALPFVADCYWCGHYHYKTVNISERFDPQGAKTIAYCMSGAYMQPYQEQPQHKINSEGFKTNYVVEAGLKPQGRGAVRLTVGHSADRFNSVRAEV